MSTVAGEVLIAETKPAPQARGRVSRILDESSTFELKHLHEYCYADPSPLSHDLATLLGAIRLADRAILRKHSLGWERRLYVELPVYELGTWRSTEVASNLTACLQYLTADTWEFRFVKRRRKPREVVQQHVVGSPEREKVFIPFSHGLDSYAQSQILRSKERVEIVPVNINSVKKALNWKTLSKRRVPGTVPVSSLLVEPHHTEPSFRTRPFIYDLMAAYGAAMCGARRVLIPENGQGTLGGSLVPLGPEAPHRSCHPAFTSLLKTVVEGLTGSQIEFEHPALFKTKGAVLEELRQVAPDSNAWLTSHWSCSYDARHAHQGGRQVHCGVCGNCVLRRMSARAAKIDDPTVYRISMRSPRIEDGLEQGERVKELRAYRDVSHNSARSMQRLADLADQPQNPRLWAEAYSVATAKNLSIENAKKGLDDLLGQHKKEWHAFVNDAGKESWLAQNART